MGNLNSRVTRLERSIDVSCLSGDQLRQLNVRRLTRQQIQSLDVTQLTIAQLEAIDVRVLTDGQLDAIIDGCDETERAWLHSLSNDELARIKSAGVAEVAASYAAYCASVL